MKTPRGRLILALSVYLTMSRIVTGDEGEYVEQVQQLIRWLPTETESLLVSKGDPGIKKGVQGFAPSCPCGVTGALHVVRKGKFEKLLKGHAVVLAAAASCRFRGPDKFLGVTRFAGGQLVLFKEELNSASDDFLKALAKEADASLMIKGRTVLRFQEQPLRDKWTFYVTFATPRVLVVATDEDYLRRLLDRMDDAPDDSFLTEKRLTAALPLDAKLWAVRCYKSPDPEAPPGSIGFVFRLIDSERADIMYVAEKPARSRSVADMWSLFPPIGTPAELQEARDGVFKFRHAPEEDQDKHEWLSGLLMLLTWRLGHKASL
jgi:hypothetical protein